MGIKFDADGLSDDLATSIAEIGAWMMQFTDMCPSQINHELAKRAELARMLSADLSARTMQ